MDEFFFPSRQADDPTPADPDTLEMFPEDAVALDRALLKKEGAFLHQAELAAAALERRVSAAHPNVLTFPIQRDELARLAQQFAQVVDIAKHYHLDAADPAA